MLLCGAPKNGIIMNITIRPTRLEELGQVRKMKKQEMKVFTMYEGWDKEQKKAKQSCRKNWNIREEHEEGILAALERIYGGVTR